MSNNEQPNYYAVIPANVRYNKNLKPSEKLMYGEITALSNKEGYCFASNDYFAKLYNVSKMTVSQWITSLERESLITRELIYRENSKEIIQRHIRIIELQPINMTI